MNSSEISEHAAKGKAEEVQNNRSNLISPGYRLCPTDLQMLIINISKNIKFFQHFHFTIFKIIILFSFKN